MEMHRFPVLLFYPPDTFLCAPVIMRFASWKRQICYSKSQKCKSLDFFSTVPKISCPTLGSGILVSKVSFINDDQTFLKVPVLLIHRGPDFFLSHCVLQTQCVCVQHYLKPSAGNMTHVIRVCADTVGHAENAAGVRPDDGPLSRRGLKGSSRHTSVRMPRYRAGTMRGSPGFCSTGIVQCASTCADAGPGFGGGGGTIRTEPPPQPPGSTINPGLRRTCRQQEPMSPPN